MRSKYYDDKESLSNSSLKYLEVSSRYFSEMMNKSSDDEEHLNPAMITGTAIHAYLLENKTFFDNFYIEKAPKPSSPNQYLFANLIIAGNDLKYAYSNSYKEYNEKKAEALYQELFPYIEEIKSSNGKTPLQQSAYETITHIERNIEKHKLARELILSGYLDDDKSQEGYNEIEFKMIIKDIPFKMKIDRYVVDLSNKIIKVIDVKSYGAKSQRDKRTDRIKEKLSLEAIDRQLGLYGLPLKMNYPLFTFEYYVVFVGTTYPYHVDVVQIPLKKIEKSLEKVYELIEDYKIVKSNNFDHDAYYYKNDGLLIIDYE
jgi:hypothetical protein